MHRLFSVCNRCSAATVVATAIRTTAVIDDQKRDQNKKDAITAAKIVKAIAHISFLLTFDTSSYVSSEKACRIFYFCKHNVGR